MTDANPQTEAPITDEKSAIEAVTDFLGADSQPDPEPQPAKANPEDQEAAPDETESQPETEVEPETSEEIELPETLEALAEALEVNVDDLAKHLKVTRKVGGTPESITLADALRDHQLYADYQAKTSELAEQRRVVDAERSQHTQAWQQRFSQLDDLIGGLHAQINTGPSDEDLDRILLEEGPETFLKAKGQRDRFKTTLDQAMQKRQEELQRYQHDNSQRQAEFRAKQQNMLLSRMPELASPEKLSAFETSVYSFMGDNGFDRAEVEQWLLGPWDHRQMVILDKAIKAWESEKKAPQVRKKLKNLPRVMQPGTPTTKSEQANEKSAAIRDKLRQAGKKGTRKQQDAAAMEFVSSRVLGEM